MKPLLVTVTSLLAALTVSGQLHAGLQREGSDAVLTDRPRCRFAWPDWDYTNITNPLLLTKNSLDRSMIGIMRIRAGDTLPRGKRKVAMKMTTQQITSLLRENLQGRGSDIGSISFSRATIAGTDAVRVSYAQRGKPAKRGVEYGFLRDGHFFHLLFVANEGPDYASEQKDFERVASTFRVVE
jgi:hypothetical protein